MIDKKYNKKLSPVIMKEIEKSKQLAKYYNLSFTENLVKELNRSKILTKLYTPTSTEIFIKQFNENRLLTKLYTPSFSEVLVKEINRNQQLNFINTSTVFSKSIIKYTSLTTYFSSFYSSKNFLDKIKEHNMLMKHCNLFNSFKEISFIETQSLTKDYNNSIIAKMLKNETKSLNDLDNNKIFKTIWDNSIVEITPTTEETVQTEIINFIKNFDYLKEKLSNTDIVEKLNLNKLIEEINQETKTYISKKNMLSIISFLIISTQSTDKNISKKAIHLLETVGKISKTDLGAGFLSLIGIISFFLGIVSLFK